MKKYIYSLLLSLCVPLTVSANPELVQIVSLSWDNTAKKLTAISFGSGTAIAKNLVITNKHVVKVGNKVADFLLLCPAQAQESRAVKCNVAAGVSALHNTIDVALIRTLDPKTFLPSVRTSNAIRSKDDVVRVVGFPTPDETATQGFGGTKTVKAFETWQENPSKELNIKGDTPTITRGRVMARYKLESTGAFYTKTSAKVNFGNSGGAAFDQFGAYIGIPTLKDSAGNSYILEYAQLRAWVQDRSTRKARFSTEAYDHYLSLIGKKSATSKKQVTTKVKRSSRYQYLRALAIKRASQGKSSAATTRYTTQRHYSSPYGRR